MRVDDKILRGLMADAQAGNRRAYAMLLDEARGWLKGYYRRRVPPEQLEDLVQETLISLHRKLSSYDPARPFLPWLAAIARYRWIDHLRKLSRGDDPATHAEVATESEEPAIAAKLSLERLLENLSDSQAEAIRLVKVQGYSISEAAETTGQSEPLVKVNIHRGIKKLAALVEKD